MTPFVTMTLLVAAVYTASKVAMFRRLPAARQAAYLLLWPGMDPRPFRESRPPAGLALMAWGALKMAVGAALLQARTGVTPVDLLLVMLGTGLLIHFGLCDVLAGFWRRRGIPVERLFVNPAASRTLAEFWGRRWNLAFRAVAHARIFTPVKRRWGARWGVAATFAFSGLVHELLLSVPAGGGWGGPTLYFLLHGALVLAERRWKIEGRLWTLFWLLAPLPLLFHPPFLRAVLVPLL